MIKLTANRFDTCLCQEEGARSWSVLKEDYMMGASSMKVESFIGLLAFVLY